MKLTTNFSLSEFKCKDGTEVPEKYHANVKELATNLQVLKDYLGCSISVNSGYRTVEHNKAQGGKPSSLHLIAKAADIYSKEKTPKEISKAILHLIKEGKMQEGGLKEYKTFVHYDVRGKKARW